MMKNRLLKITFVFGLITNLNSVVAQCWQSISAGNAFSAGIKQDGTLWTWGSNNNGQLGIGSVTSGLYSETQIGTSNSWQKVSAAYDYVLAIKTDGTLWAWGANYNGTLGDGTKVSQSTPKQIGTDSDWQFVCGGYRHAAAIKTDGTLWMWGDNSDGELGDGTTSEKLIPTKVGTDNNWTSVSLGNNVSLALKSNGTIWAWGSNSSGQLGNGSTWGTHYTPVQIGSDTNWQKVFSTWATSFAIKNNGTLWAWGNNQNGILGNGNTSDQSIPSQVGTASNWANVDGYFTHIIATKTNGTLWAWGQNNFGQLGNGTTTSVATYTPTQIGTDNNWSVVSGDLYYSQALKNDGSRWAWGYNSNGQLGDGSSAHKNSPVTASCPTSIITNLNSLSNLQSNISVYPNPASSFLTIEVKEQTQISIINMLGELVKSETINNISKLDMGHLNAGVYFIQDLKSGKAIKFIKE